MLFLETKILALSGSLKLADFTLPDSEVEDIPEAGEQEERRFLFPVERESGGIFCQAFLSGLEVSLSFRDRRERDREEWREKRKKRKGGGLEEEKTKRTL